MKTTVIHHSGDYDGIFCREIARKFLPNAELIGWDFTDKPLAIPDGQIYILDLPVDRVFGWVFRNRFDANQQRALMNPQAEVLERLIWIDHHKSSIESHPTDIPGYRIDGVAACRLAWQWFRRSDLCGGVASEVSLPDKAAFAERTVSEPLAVRLAGTYDVWDESNGPEDWECCLAFQFGLDATETLDWGKLLQVSDVPSALHKELVDDYTNQVLERGWGAMQCYKTRDAAMVKARSFLVEFEGLKFLALTTARCNSQTFAARDVPETGHDALMAFFFNGRGWTFSLYHAAHRKDIDLSLIAANYGGGGHRGACGFPAKDLSFGANGHNLFITGHA